MCRVKECLGSDYMSLILNYKEVENDGVCIYIPKSMECLIHDIQAKLSYVYNDDNINIIVVDSDGNKYVYK